MARQPSAADIEKAIQALTKAEKTNLGIEVTLPVAFGDGALISVVVEQDGEGFSIHDAGFSAMRLTGAGVALSKHVVFRLNEFARRYRCEFAQGRVYARSDFNSIANVACLVANASRAVADYVYELRRQVEYDFRIVVFDKLKEIVGQRLRDSEDLIGASGTHYRLPIILDQQQKTPQNFVASLANHSGVARNVSMFFDLRPQYPKVERDSVYDGDADIRKEDRALLRSTGAEVFALKEAALRFREILGHA